jgi:hypothetical protein
VDNAPVSSTLNICFGAQPSSSTTFLNSRVNRGHAVAQLVETLCHKPEGRGFDSQ